MFSNRNLEDTRNSISRPFCPYSCLLCYHGCSFTSGSLPCTKPTTLGTKKTLLSVLNVVSNWAFTPLSIELQYLRGASWSITSYCCFKSHCRSLLFAIRTVGGIVMVIAPIFCRFQAEHIEHLRRLSPQISSKCLFLFSQSQKAPCGQHALRFSLRDSNELYSNQNDQVQSYLHS